MSSRSYTRFNRPVTACRECHRRKQKCDRMKPCGMCLGRNIPEKCVYGNSSPKIADAVNQGEQDAPPIPPSDHEATSKQEADPSPSTLEQQIGYSALSNNALLDLYESINAIHVPTAGSLGLSTIPLQTSSEERYFRVIAQLPAAFVCESLVDAYFTEANWYCASLDRYFFSGLHAAWKAAALSNESNFRLEQYPRDLQRFPALLFQVLAVGLQFSIPGSDALRSLQLDDFAATEKLSQLYSDLGCEIMHVLGQQTPSITGIEHDLMRMNWLKNSSRGTEARHSVGSAVGQAQDLELHLEPETENDNDIGVSIEQLWYAEYRRRVWARVFYTDSHMAMVLGRPKHVQLDDCTTNIPIDCDIPDNLTISKPAPPGPDQIPSSFTYVIFLYQIGLKIHEIVSVKSKRALQTDYSKVERIHHDVEAILDSLPPALQPQNPNTKWDQLRPQFPKLRQQILSSAHSFLVKLHRPFINNEPSQSALIRASLDTLDAQQALFECLDESKNQHRIYGFSFYTIDAAILLSAITIDRHPHNPDLANHIHRCLLQAIYRLGNFKKVSKVAASGEKLLVQCYAEITARYPMFKGTVDSLQMSMPDLAATNFSYHSGYLEDYNIPDREFFESGASTGILDDMN